MKERLTLEEMANRDCDNAIKSAQYTQQIFDRLFGVFELPKQEDNNEDEEVTDV